MADIRHNDYIRLTANYLRDLAYDKGAVDNLTSRIKELKETLADVSTKIVGYEEKQGGQGELTPVEAEAEKRIADEKILSRCNKDLRKMQYHIFRVEKALDLLGEEDRQALILHYCDRRSYEDIANILKWSPRTCNRRVKEGTKLVAYMLFGDKAKENVYFVC